MKKHVVVGPYQLARRFVQRHGWSEDMYIIVTRGHQLAQLDPALIVAIICVQMNGLGQRIVAELRREIDAIRALWPVPAVAAS